MITLAPPTVPTVIAPSRRGLTIVALRDELWRVTRTGGDVLGYIELATEQHGATRYRAKRMVVRQHRFVGVGEFWNMDDAVDSLRF